VKDPMMSDTAKVEVEVVGGSVSGGLAILSSNLTFPEVDTLRGWIPSSSVAGSWNLRKT